MNMKKIIALLLAMSICLLCAACGGDTAPETTEAPVADTNEVTTTAAAEEVTDVATEESPESAGAYTNPLTGEALDAPITTRPVVVSVSNVQEALPHRGVNKADILFESLVNGTIVRCLAVYADISEVEEVGSTRSARPILIDIASHYNAFYAHAGASDHTYGVLAQYGIDNMNVDTWDDSGYSFRDEDRNEASSWEHCLFTRGPELLKHIAKEGKVDMSQDADASFGLQFVENGTPEGGETAETVSITLKFNGTMKETIMVYNAETGKYEYNQYGKTMVDEADGKAEGFTNVIVMYTDMNNVEGYHTANFVAGGSGYYACGGKIIPIQWKCAGEDQPFTYYTEDGEVLNMGVGSTYIALTVPGAPVTCK